MLECRHHWTRWSKIVTVTGPEGQSFGECRATIVVGTPQTDDWNRHCLECLQSEQSIGVQATPAEPLVVSYGYVHQFPRKELVR